MPLRHPAVALAKAKKLESPQNNSEVYKAHAEARLSQRLTDRPTNRQNSFENMRMVSKCALTRPKQICAKQVQVFPTTLGGHENQLPLLTERFRSTCPRLEDTATDRVLCVSSSVSVRSRSGPKRPSSRSSPNHPWLANSRKPQSFQSNLCEGLRVVLGSFQLKPL